jgi:hypothetical protein
MAEPHGPWIQTVSGIKFPLLDPSPRHFNLFDISWHLSRINRYTGAIQNHHYSVAEHSLYVAEVTHAICVEKGFTVTRGQAIAAGLMHDAHEAYLGDLSAPLKKVLRDLGSTAYDDLTEHYQDIIAKKYGIPKLQLGRNIDVVTEADMMVLEAEKSNKYIVADFGHDWRINRTLTRPEAWQPDPLSWGMSPSNAQLGFMNAATTAGLSDE